MHTTHLRNAGGLSAPRTLLLAAASALALAVTGCSANDGDDGSNESSSALTSNFPNLFEAERGSFVGSQISDIHAGFSGTGFVDFLEPTNAKLTFNFVTPGSGNYDLVIRYANASTSPRPLRVLVNGELRVAALSFPPTASWTDWRTVSVPVSLPPGGNRLELEALGASGANIDSLRVVAK